MSDRPDLLSVNELLKEVRREVRELISSSIKQGWWPEGRVDGFATSSGPSHAIESLATSLGKAAALRTRMQEAYADLDFPAAAPGHVGRLRRAVVLAGVRALTKGSDGPEWLIKMIDSGRVRSEPQQMACEFPELFADAQAAEDALTDLASDPHLWSP
jgi:hypothetical protein